MYKRKYVAKICLKVVMIVVVPLAGYLIVVGLTSPPQGIRSFMFWLLATTSLWILFLAGVAQLLGSSLPKWIGWDLLRTLQAFDRTTERTLKDIRDKLPVLERHLARSEVSEVWNELEQQRAVLIVGESGSGKSGIAAEVVRQAIQRGIPTLFLDTRNYSSSVSAPGDLGRYVGIEPPLRDSLSIVASRVGKCLLVVDQLDSSIGTPASQLSIELLASVANLRGMIVVGASCLLDTAEHQQTRDLGFNTVQSRPVDELIVKDVLHEVGIARPSRAVLALSESLFNLSVLTDVAKHVDINQVKGEVALLETYLHTLEMREGPEIIEVAINLAYDSLASGKSDFALPRIRYASVQRLLARGLIISVGHGLYRFRHEQLLYFLYAQGAIQRNAQPHELLARIAGHRAEGALVWTARIHYHQKAAELAAYLEQALAVNGQLDFYEKAALLDEVESWSDPTADPAAFEAFAKALQTDVSLSRYFFRRIAHTKNLAWFAPLASIGVYDATPDRIEGEGRITYPEWPPLPYLVVLASIQPESFVYVVERIQTRHIPVMGLLVDAAHDMPPIFAAQIVPTVLRWTDSGMHIGREVITLADHLAQGNQWPAAFELVDLLLSPATTYHFTEEKPIPFMSARASSRANIHHVQTFVHGGLNRFAEQRPLQLLRIVQRNLERAIEFEMRGNRDGSSVWRPAIEPHEQNEGSSGMKSLLVDAAIQALTTLVMNTPDVGREIAEEYLGHRYSIFRRLAVETIGQNAEDWPDLFEHLFVQIGYLFDTELHHEYWMLMHQRFGVLPLPIRTAFAQQILDRLPQEPVSDEVQHRRQQYQVLIHLWAIRDHLSDERHLRSLQQLEQEFGEPEHPSFLSYTRTLTGSITPRTPEELCDLPVDELLAELQTELPLDAFEGPCHEGLADALQAAVERAPQHFAVLSPRLLDPAVPPIHTCHALRGLRQALIAGKAFDWQPVLELCESVSLTSQIEGEAGEPIDVNPGYWTITYGGARKAVVDLLESGIDREDNNIPPEFLPRVRDILLVLADDPNPSIEYERNATIGPPHGTVDYALNVTRSRATEVLILYALHVARNGEQDQGAQDSTRSPSSRMEEVVKSKLTRKLADPSLAVRSILGTYFPQLHWLDETWAATHVESIFPLAAEQSRFWEAAWDGYLFPGRFFGYLYEYMKPQYHYAIEQLALDPQGKSGSDTSRNRLAAHLAALYWRGVETLEDDGSLIALFLKYAADETRAQFVMALKGELSRAGLHVHSTEWMRARSLWEMRFSYATETMKERGDLADSVKELAAYAEWVPLIPEDLESFYPMILAAALVSEDWQATRLLEYLSSTGDHEGFVVSLLEQLMQQDRDPWFLTMEYDTIGKILEAAVTSADEQAKSCAERVILRFGERGYDGFRPLLRLVR